MTNIQHHNEHQTGTILPPQIDNLKISSQPNQDITSSTNTKSSTGPRLHPATHAALLSLRDANPALLRKLQFSNNNNNEEEAWNLDYWNKIRNDGPTTNPIVTLDTNSGMITKLDLGGLMLRLKTMSLFFHHLEEYYSKEWLKRENGTDTEEKQESPTMLLPSNIPMLKLMNLGGTDLPTVQLYESLSKSPHVASSITELYLGGNGIGNHRPSDGIEPLVSLLSDETCCHSLKILDLRYNDLNPKHMESLSNDVLARKDCTIEILHLEGNCIRCDGMTSIGLALKTNMSIRELYLGSNDIMVDGMVGFVKEGYKYNHTLVKLYLEGNGIRNGGADALSEVLEGRGERKVLEKVYVDNNMIGKDATKRLARAVHGAAAVSDSLFE